MSIFFIDTDAELWYDKSEALGLHVIKMPYILDGKEYFDDVGKTQDYKEFFARVRSGSMPKTAALNVQDYLDYFEPHFIKGEEIFYLTFSHKLSGTFQFMDMALEELKLKYPDVQFRSFDTKSISMGAGFQCYYAGKMYQEGKSFDEIIDFLTELREHTCIEFVVDDLNHLKRGGRISPALAVIGGLLGIKPVLKILPDGSIDKVDIVKGSKRVISYMVDTLKNNGLDMETYDIWLMHGDCEERGNELAEAVRQQFPQATVHLQIIGPVIGAHCGPGTLGMVYHGKVK